MPDITFSCPKCDQELEAPPDFIGEAVECPGCGAEIVVPNQKGPAKSGPNEPHDDDDELDEDEEDLSEKPDDDVCPECGAEMEPDSVLCLSCGYHTRLKRKMQTDLDADSENDE